MNEILFILQATLGMYVEAATKALRGLFRNWVLLVGALLAFLVYVALSGILAPMGMPGGFVLGFVGAALLSLYFRWLSVTTNKDTLGFKELLDFDFELFSCIIGVGFILYIGDVIFRASFQHPDAPQWIPACYGLGIFLIFNSIPEVIHQRRHDSLQAFRTAFEFNRESWIEWFIPFLIILIPWISVNYLSVLLSLSTSAVLLPMLTIYQAFQVLLSDIPAIPRILLAFMLGHWFMLFRAHLFNELSTGTRRRRIYQLKNR